jgi:uncharacterized membrane protein
MTAGIAIGAVAGHYIILPSDVEASAHVAQLASEMLNCKVHLLRPQVRNTRIQNTEIAHQKDTH